MLQSIRVLSVSSVGGPPAGLYIRGAPWLRPQDPKKGCGVEGPGAHFQIVRLVNDTSLIGPEAVQRKQQILKGHT